MRRIYVQQHRDYGASWIGEDTGEEIGGVSDTDVVVPLEDVRELEAQRDRLREALKDLVISLTCLTSEVSEVHGLESARATLAETGG